MKPFLPIIEKCTSTDLFVGFVPGIAGAHPQGTSVVEVIDNLREVIGTLFAFEPSPPLAGEREKFSDVNRRI